MEEIDREQVKEKANASISVYEMISKMQEQMGSMMQILERVVKKQDAMEQANGMPIGQERQGTSLDQPVNVQEPQMQAQPSEAEQLMQMLAQGAGGQ